MNVSNATFSSMKVGLSSDDRYQHRCINSYSGKGEARGRSSRCPSVSQSVNIDVLLHSASGPNSAYGCCPKLNISHIKTPKDQTSDFSVKIFVLTDSGDIHFSGIGACIG
ncbi:hypothetical protein BV898_06484 [Hypsibius exemplaris]|uniref:Uncharacterized protein n=1 Tax=Hypsibius exemplaris TaxID=2072580 RepID=A0A1W0WWA9_HYPEX|nr:hypothetical protein BV898_06484 [Hypsibius exemplaris]